MVQHVFFLLIYVILISEVKSNTLSSKLSFISFSNERMTKPLFIEFGFNLWVFHIHLRGEESFVNYIWLDILCEMKQTTNDNSMKESGSACNHVCVCFRLQKHSVFRSVYSVDDFVIGSCFLYRTGILRI